MNEAGTTFNKFKSDTTTTGKRDPRRKTKKERLQEGREYAPVTFIPGDVYMRMKEEERDNGKG